VQFLPERARFAQRLEKLADAVDTTILVFDALVRWQRAWAFLQPILSSEDIVQQLPNEVAAFRAVDGVWRKTIRAAEETGLLVKFALGNRNISVINRSIETLEG
ncbi:hypothetical protein T492DRAFT_570248, partial [Pavlovales sp. CCMP2436]